MTSTIERPVGPARPPRRPGADEPARSPRALGAAAALWAAAAGLLLVLLPVLLVWGTDSRSGTGAVDAARSAGRIWLYAHGATLEVPGGRLALTPLGLLLVPLLLLARLAASAAHASGPTTPAQALRLALWTGGPYAVLALLVSLLVNGPDVQVSPVLALLGGLVTGIVGALAGALRPARLWRAAWYLLPRRARRLAAATGGALAAVLGAGALLVGASLIAHVGQAVDLARASDPGAAGGAGLLLAGLALVPNAVVWGVSWLAGPGFAVGVGTAVGPYSHELGPVPALPLLAGLPGSGVPEWIAVLVLAVPLLAGALAGLVVVQDLSDELPSWGRTALEAAAVGPVAGAALGLLAWLSGGAAGGERLAQLGPSPWRVALAATATVAVGSAVAALARRQRLLERPHSTS